ncbi:MAG: peptide chain release factor N(5)-glutamine methyltransferase [Xenococcaceae cyanobacterium MO_207.B15]|nr:peptide chain release factor N(5)-glutamine methyltransferase [Xenococcaceae cyanobacterium MO_207.B15]
MEKNYQVSGKELYLWRRTAIDRALAAQIAVKEIDWLLQQVSDLDPLSLRLESFKNRSLIPLQHSIQQLTLLWEKRLTEHLPVQYIVGQVPWRNFQLSVSPGVLIPRPETELIIEIAQQANGFSSEEEAHWVDLGTGSGAIALGLASVFPYATIHATDCSKAALAIAKTNAVTAKLNNQIQFYQGDWWSPLKHLKGKIRGMVSNPPYIPSSELPQLQPEVFKHEPHLALDGGTDGLDAIRYLVKASPEYLMSGGLWLIEMMAGQAKAVVKMLSEQGDYRDIKVISDLAGIERFVLAFRR